jgi:hypothetical protein
LRSRFSACAHRSRCACTFGVCGGLSLRVRDHRSVCAGCARSASKLDILASSLPTCWRLSPIGRALLENLQGLLRLQLTESLTLHPRFFFAPRRFSRSRRLAFKLERKRLLLGKKFRCLLVARRLLFVFPLGFGLLG